MAAYRMGMRRTVRADLCDATELRQVLHVDDHVVQLPTPAGAAAIAAGIDNRCADFVKCERAALEEHKLL